MRNSSFYILHSTFYILHSTFYILHSSFYIQHSSFSIHHSAFIIQHSSFSIHHSKPIPHPNRSKPFEAGTELKAAEPMFPTRSDAEQRHMQRREQRARLTVMATIYIEIRVTVVSIIQIVVCDLADKFGQPKRQLGVKRDVRSVKPREPQFRQEAKGVVSAVADAWHGLSQVLDFQIHIMDILGVQTNPQPFRGTEVIGEGEHRRSVEPWAEQAFVQVEVQIKTDGHDKHKVPVKQRDAGRIPQLQLELMAEIWHRRPFAFRARFTMPLLLICDGIDGQFFEICTSHRVCHQPDILMRLILTKIERIVHPSRVAGNQRIMLYLIVAKDDILFRLRIMISFLSNRPCL